jgi:hypothetical protein
MFLLVPQVTLRKQLDVAPGGGALVGAAAGADRAAAAVGVIDAGKQGGAGA